MRQAGVLAAAGIIALEEMTDRLAEDHKKAKTLAQQLQAIPGIQLDKGSPNTNMVYIKIDQALGVDANAFQARLRSQGILVGVTGPYHFRLVCHYWISDENIKNVVDAFSRCVSAQL